MTEAMNHAMRIIRSEHRTLAAVIHGMKTLIGEIRDGRGKPNFPLLWMMLYYIEAYPEKLHHPKEDDFLFTAVRARAPEAVPLLSELGSQHQNSERQLNDLRAALGRYEAGVTGSLQKLVATMDRYAEFYWKHMALEEEMVFPLAVKHLTEADWSTIATHFAANDDPLVRTDIVDDFWQILRRIVFTAPDPVGLGG